ncbi:unnamed protein product [Caenorhabditis sp. 36 PRJEB53466]|nr:unnamed protein product [Caenorhabditis sp. 36 PRJEB53466]
MYLNQEQLVRLQHVLFRKELQIHNSQAVYYNEWIAKFPTIRTTLADLLNFLYKIFEKNDIPVRESFLIGGAASSVIVPEYSSTDYDILFKVQATDDFIEKQFISEKIKCAIDEALKLILKSAFPHLPPATWVYICKNVKIISKTGDAWLLIALHNLFGKHIELKFVWEMKRQFEFPTDSLQICLNPLLTGRTNRHLDVPLKSSYGDVKEVIELISRKLIKLVRAQEMRGGGFLKYCLLKSRGFFDDQMDLSTLNNLRNQMTEKFLSDFRSQIEGGNAIILSKYLVDHLGNGTVDQRGLFLQTVFQMMHYHHPENSRLATKFLTVVRRLMDLEA